MSSEHDQQRTDEPAPPPPTLLDKPTVTIYLDGLIYTAFNQRRSLYQGAIHTKAEGHHLTVNVRHRGEKEPFWPRTSADWNPSHEAIKRRAPFWLYVDSGRKLQEDEFSARLYRRGLRDPQSIQHVLSLEGLHARRLPLLDEAFAEFNFPHGVAYSALNADAELKRVPPHSPASAATPLRRIRPCTLSAVDIDLTSDANTERHIVLANENGDIEFFRERLETGVHYEIRILNEPIHHHNQDEPENHFLQFYELFKDFPADESRFLVELIDPDSIPNLRSEPDSPPCIPPNGNLIEGLTVEESD